MCSNLEDKTIKNQNSDPGPRANEAINAAKVRLIDADGENVGVVHVTEALEMSEEAGLDLVEIAPNANPPVTKIMDFGKYKYDLQKRLQESRRKQKTIEVKEIKFRPATDTHDFDTKVRLIQKFIGEGNKVKVSLRFRGREIAFTQLGREKLQAVANEVEAYAKVEVETKMEGRQIMMILAPR